MRRAYRSIAVVVATTAVLAGCLMSGAGATAVPARGTHAVHSGARASGARFVSSARQTHTISFDQDSLMIDGRRTVFWSGEFEY